MRPGLAASLLLAALGAAATAAGASCRDPDVAGGFPRQAHAASPDALIEYFGHNFFQITSKRGTRIVTDPLAPGMHPTPALRPHVVTIGREHPNHNYVQLVQGNPVILRGLVDYGAEWNKISTTVGDVLIYSLPIYQQQFGNALKGAAFVFDLGLLCIAHLGDLSHKLAPSQLKALGKVDVAMIPIGGTFTMPPATAREVLDQLKPKIAIPMHYREDMALLGMFLEGLPHRRLGTHSFPVSKSALPARTEIVVLSPWAGREDR
ncbi:MAG TPA: MBL fold metallo-hydrolase [candidate division Zixibacteria bacterium]|nr:MBL fold metallo-hydrolase [candidate division Zixibacteria bacterium]